MKIADVFHMMRPMPVFKPEMRKANREGRKSQTRRVMDPQPETMLSSRGKIIWKNWEPDDFGSAVLKYCPYGKAGDYCYMREPLIGTGGEVAYYMDEDAVIARHFLTGDPIPWRWKKDVLSGMFMPKEAARLIYRYKSIRVERLQDISEEDAIAEGAPLGRVLGYGRLGMESHREGFIELWESINAKRGYGWDVNPWVWALEYAPVEVQHG